MVRRKCSDSAGEMRRSARSGSLLRRLSGGRNRERGKILRESRSELLKAPLPIAEICLRNKKRTEYESDDNGKFRLSSIDGTD